MGDILWRGLPLIMALVWSYLKGVAPARILLAPFPVTSHVTQFMLIGDALIDDKHDLYVMMSDSSPDVNKYSGSRIKIIQYHAEQPDFYSTDVTKATKLMDDSINNSPMKVFRQSREEFTPFCHNPLGDERFYQKLKSLNFDLAIVDIFPSNRCILILMYRLGVPYVGMATVHEPWLSRSPALPSFVPFSIGTGFTEHMNFWERFQNAWELWDWSMSPRVTVLDDSLVVKYAPGKPVVSLDDLAGKCLLFLVNNDMILDYPRPLMPNEIFLGGLTHRPAQNLPLDLEDFVNSSPDGVIVVSFGSISMALPDSAVPKFMAAFGQLEQRVVWRTPSTKPKSTPPNVKLVDWLPQNDLLGHPKTKLFITHSGANGQFEALYHGVPMIAMPSFAEQKYNANRMVYHRFGLQMDVRNFEMDEPLANIRKVIGDRTFKDNIVKASKIYQSQPLKSTEKVVYWIDHVLRYGGDHLRSHALDMPWYQFLMLDILAVLLLAYMVVLGTLYFTCLCLYTKCLARKSTGKLKHN